MYDLVIRGDVVTPSGVLNDGGIGIRAGTIAAVWPAGEVPNDATSETWDCSGQWVLPGGIDIGTFQRLIAEGLARAFGLYPRKGSLTPGADADVVIIDPHTSWTVTPETLYSNAGWSPYDGWTLQGRVAKTVVRGRLVYDGTRVIGQPGYGEFIPPVSAGTLAAVAG